jgi:hypothetical protein
MADGERVQVMPASADVPRVDTGAVQFGTDWPGLFIRGDEAHNLMLRIRQLSARLAGNPDPEIENVLGLLNHYAEMIDKQVIVR